MQVKKYFEKKVSLLSTSDVRYDGELYTVDPSEQSIALKHVNCMGTEGRRSGDQAIAPSDCTYEFIIFRAVNIRELWLDEGNGDRRDLTNEILIPLRQGQTNNNYQKRDMYDQEAPKRKVGYQSHSHGHGHGGHSGHGHQQQYDPYYGGGHGQYDNYYRPQQQQQPPPPAQPYYEQSHGYAPQQPPPQQTYYDTPSQNNYYRQQQSYPQRGQPRYGQHPPPVNPYQSQPRRQRPPQYYNQQQQRAPAQYYNQGYQNRRQYASRPQYGYNQQPRRQYNKYAYNNRYQSGGYQRQQQRGQSGGYNRGRSGTKGTESQQAGTGAFLDTRRLRGTEIDITNEQDFDFGAAKNEFDQKDDNEQTQQNGVSIIPKEAVEPQQQQQPVEEDAQAAATNEETKTEEVDDGADDEEAVEKKYDKSKSFFDGLQTETKKSKPKQDLQQQKDTDTKTFGSVAATYKSRHMTNRQQGRYNQNRNRNYFNQRQQQYGGYGHGHQQQGGYQRQYNQYNRQQYQRQPQPNAYTTSKWVRR